LWTFSPRAAAAHPVGFGYQRSDDGRVIFGHSSSGIER
jgi:hypothetical protein